MPIGVAGRMDSLLRHSVVARNKSSNVRACKAMHNILSFSLVASAAACVHRPVGEQCKNLICLAHKVEFVHICTSHWNTFEMICPRIAFTNSKPNVVWILSFIILFLTLQLLNWKIGEESESAVGNMLLLILLETGHFLKWPNIDLLCEYFPHIGLCVCDAGWQALSYKLSVVSYWKLFFMSSKFTTEFFHYKWIQMQVCKSVYTYKVRAVSLTHISSCYIISERHKLTS